MLSTSDCHHYRPEEHQQEVRKAFPHRAEDVCVSEAVLRALLTVINLLATLWGRHYHSSLIEEENETEQFPTCPGAQGRSAPGCKPRISELHAVGGCVLYDAEPLRTFLPKKGPLFVTPPTNDAFSPLWCLDGTTGPLKLWWSYRMNPQYSCKHTFLTTTIKLLSKYGFPL